MFNIKEKDVFHVRSKIVDENFLLFHLASKVN